MSHCTDCAKYRQRIADQEATTESHQRLIEGLLLDETDARNELCQAAAMPPDGTVADGIRLLVKRIRDLTSVTAS